MSDLINRRDAIDAMVKYVADGYAESPNDSEGYMGIVKELPSAEPDHGGDVNGKVDLINRQDAIDAIKTMPTVEAMGFISTLPSAEPLTDAEQRIFLKAISREEEVCKIVDEEYKDEGYKLNLVHACHEIERKVKGALWT